ncbi:Gfo/Idh/MocA family protein [Bordetella hinzii]|uniref:Oxidoreductase, NAD-binding domain protein n=1 Tax=Bordetella hinzii OH87 BAL007II TaxID=1331262 RepID=A0ABR4R1S1_9BORD|nr:Gfo/Idh/MocA family oxidoreductase [Bordetella hinzii]KCB24020.1 oxidoreductase, NAD-binding domain protein [Bordetella hinzii OH87 BAL007II]KCB45652.1 oxidoreductase, NAD-binding domain protein [Bordetella hinzii 5132]QDJ41536.1 gfo/Idh/MocA family oxidoreductase [Bordetella hinzii]QDJ46090.1 gfo/Idh/MocA family oxidoreductase [Bordetella hinzii]QDJ55009.1 gfo/Idh/MocA family oxidoreductase [Bordetella hinzii]
MTLPLLRLGIVGLGRAFTLMLPTFLNDPRVKLVAACDPRAEARQRFAADFGCPVYESPEALAADPSVQALYIASPHQCHAEHTRIAAAHGKHVLVEKPMALSLDECDAMIEACRAASVHLVIGHCHSFDTPYLETRRLIESGEYGAVKMILALNYTDYLYRPRRPEELATDAGGGAVFSQAAHQVDIVRLLAGRRALSLRSALGNWDPARPTEGAYSALLWFDGGAYASLNYNGYGHFDSDEWMDWVGEMGAPKRADDYGQARRKLATVSARQEAQLKAEGTYGGKAYVSRPADHGASPPGLAHQHFGSILVSCEGADLRPTSHGIHVYGDQARRFLPLRPPAAPRLEVIDELHDAVYLGKPCLHDGQWAKGTLEICLAMLASDRGGHDVGLAHQA